MERYIFNGIDYENSRPIVYFKGRLELQLPDYGASEIINQFYSLKKGSKIWIEKKKEDNSKKFKLDDIKRIYLQNRIDNMILFWREIKGPQATIRGHDPTSPDYEYSFEEAENLGMLD